MKKLVLAVLCVITFIAGPSRAEEPDIRRSVVKIFTFAQSSNYYQPWQMNAQQAMTGSGAIIAGGRILTNAHVVSDQVYIQVRKAGDPKKYTAHVEFVAHDGELATLRVDDPAFFKNTAPLKLGGLPRQGDKVTAFGFPEGGDELSVTQGIVSRIEVTTYAHSWMNLLTIQTDAAINPGNSGGPAIKDGKIIGVTFQSLTGGQNIGYIVPVMLVERFLTDIKDGHYDGIPVLGVDWQAMENDAFRKYYGMTADQSGVLVKDVIYGASAWGVIKPGDVLTSINGTAIANDGTVELRKGERVMCVHTVSLYQSGALANLGIIRDGKPMRVTVRMKPPVQLVPGPLYEKRPSYFIFGGLVFTVLTNNYLSMWKWENVPTALKYQWEFGQPSEHQHEVVVLSSVLAHDINAGYHSFNGLIINRINGRKISSLADALDAFKTPQGGYHVIETDTDTDASGRIVLDAAGVERANKEIMERFKIPADRSPDLAAPEAK